MLGHDLIKAGSAAIVVAGGMESMTNAPHMIPNSRTGNRYGNFEAVDHMAWDGLTNPYDGKAMGVFGEACADKYKFTRDRAGRVRDRIGQARAGCDCVGRVRRRNRSGQGADGRKGDVEYAHRRAAGQIRHREDPDAEAGVPQGQRHDHGGELVEHFGRRSRDRADERGRGEEARRQAACAHRRVMRRIRRNPNGSRRRRSAPWTSC